MTTMKMGESKFGAPVGTYTAKFKGIRPRPAREGSDYGPGVEWEFEVVGGPQAGRIIGRTTSPEPTTKNACGRMLQSITGGVQLAQEVDLNAYVGHLYVCMVELNQTGNGTRVGTVIPLAAVQGSSLPVPGAAPAAGPPPRPGRPPAPAPEPRLWVAPPGDGEPVQMTRHELQHLLVSGHLSPAEVAVCVEGAGEWKTAADFGFKEEIPF